MNPQNHTFIDEVKRLQGENARLREALDRIARPVWWMQEDQKRETGSINGVNGEMAVALSESAEYLKSIARDALSSRHASH